MIHPGELFFGGRVDDVYEVVARMDPGLYLDVGAAAGKVTSRLVELSPTSRVLAFEPFEGNHPFLRSRVGHLTQVDVVEKAASDFDGPGLLYVSATLSGAEKGWEGYAGYSSSGMLVPADDAHRHDARTRRVEVCSIDALVDEHVRLLKIDVQGGEMGVLRGAKETIERHGVDVIYVEYEGESEIVELLDQHGYVVFDSGVYVYSRKASGPAPEELSTRLVTHNLSSGRPVAKGAVSRRPLTAGDYTGWMHAFGRLALYTDLVAVHRSAVPAFLRAAADRLDAIET